MVIRDTVDVKCMEICVMLFLITALLTLAVTNYSYLYYQQFYDWISKLSKQTALDFQQLCSDSD